MAVKAAAQWTSLSLRKSFNASAISVSAAAALARRPSLASGTDDQKRQLRPRHHQAARSSFSQGYSEPGCGTDLAGIQCRAVRTGETYVVNGQKIYTTSAHACTHIFLMCRTDPASKRQAGLSILLVPIDTPGITVRPLWTIQNEPRAPTLTTYGEPRTNEVFFDNVQVPASCLLGTEGDGGPWHGAASTSTAWAPGAT